MRNRQTGEVQVQRDGLDWQAGWLEQLAGAATEADLLALLERAAHELGFDYCALGMRLPLPLSNPKIVLLNNYTPAWQTRYAAAQYLSVDPTVSRAMASTQPLLWTREMFASAGDLWEDARAHGLQVGWAQPVHDLKGVASLLTLARAGEEVSNTEFRDKTGQVAWLAQAAHEALGRLLAARPDGAASIRLTAREIDILRWAADGKTASETAQILQISERTVIFHIDNALRKLGAVNKTAGVLKAAMLRLI
jgi:LuxR family quorum-sensing system transcriptional regulator SolR